MKLTILQVGQTPEVMLQRFERYPKQFQGLLGNDKDFLFETKYILDGEAFPKIDDLQGIIITGSANGVYDDIVWIDPLRDLIRRAYENNLPMLGICFGHQIMAEALGGKVEKSHKGWGIGRHIYQLKQKPSFINGMVDEIAIMASHQDQVISAPKQAKVFLSSDFTPNAGLIYENGAAISLQPHPEFDVKYSKALVNSLAKYGISKEQITTAELSLDEPLDRIEVGAGLARFFKGAKK